MADRIKGITVEIGGDTTGLNKALSGTNKNIRDTQSQLKDVERLLKLDPTNTQLLRQKQRLLADRVSETKTKLDTLKKADDQVGKNLQNYDEWKRKFDPIQAEIDETEKALEKLKTKQKNMEDSGKINTANYDKLQSEINETAKKLKDLKAEAQKVSDEFGHPLSVDQYDGLQREIVQTTESLKQLEKQASQSNATLSKINRTASGIAEKSGRIAGTMAPVTAAAVAAGTAAFNYASDITESLNKVDVAFGESSEAVKRFADESLKTYGIARGTALDMAATYGDMGTSMGLTQEQAADMAISLTGLAGDLASFKNIGIDQAATALNGIFTGETESLKTLGVVMTQTNLDAYALANGFGKTTSKMTEAEKVQLRYRYVTKATRNAEGDFYETQHLAANSMRIVQEGVKELAAGFGELLLPSVTSIIQNVIKVIDWLNGLDEGQKKMIVTIIALVAAVSPVAGLISAAATAFLGLSAVITFLTSNPLVLLIAGITALVVLLATKGPEIKNILADIDNWLKTVFAVDWTTIFGPVLGAVLNSFFATVQNIWNAVLQILNGVIDFVQGVFTGNWEQAWNGVVQIFGGIFNGIVALAKAPINAVIGLINGAINAINGMINGINSIQFDIPDWVPGLGGKIFKVNIGNIPNIPYLAKGGTVVNGMAIVGEAGPELLTVSPSGTKVIPLSGTEKARGAASVNINNITFNGYTRRQGRRLVRDLNRQLGRLYK